ncbi:hypothetical protein BVRB_000810 [Beta vulgaris subsp. vulgaris]|uniref:RNA helicase n=2 Tax=Beta vulgaris subsp. vulgaris TaxID=3555 RepID=A0A0J8B5J0_BETVV|nr:ATP-dependent RNA helicase DEAH13 isoform X1 [Beta vulgaris subsp. vulgaris]KMS96276.1 hypothetical protein BVRB_000810 [Beta vulgaris subsp. vulgaris]
MDDEVNYETRVDTYTTNSVGDSPFPGCENVTTLIHVSRPKDVESGRMELPIIMKEQEIMETINNNVTVIISGGTGCGKTTQIPQFLYEAGYGSGKCPMRSGIIGITQPRRVAVLSTAKRVAFELGLQLGKEVGYQVRHDRSVGDNCSIKFMTDGILLQELKSDFMLRHYSVIILDEAHERSLNTDILVGMLSRAVKFRQEEAEKQQQDGIEKYKPNDRIYPIKLILMSATLRVEDFTSGKRIFPLSPPVINIPGNQFPVTKHFLKKTELIDYIGEAYKKVLKIHKLLPPGGILVFVTGQREVKLLCHMLRQASMKFVSRSSEVNEESEATKVTGTVVIGGYNLKNSDEVLNTVSSSNNKQQMDRFSCYDECRDKLDKNEAYFALTSEEDSESDIGSDFEDDGSDNGDAYFAVSSGEDSELDIGSDFEVHKSCKVANNIVDITEAVNSESLRAAFENLTEKSASSSDYNRNEKISATQDVCSCQPSSLTKQNADRKGPLIGPLDVLPLYAKLPEAAQLRVFEKIKEGERRVVVATNVAETSLTIPGIQYVVDTGREKVKEYNPSNGVESYRIKWTSKASASQRAGRAGRTGPGHCYCLYSSAAFTNLFPDFSTPDILKMPLDYAVLLLKSMGIGKVAKFPFPTPPDAEALGEAQSRLMYLGALDSKCRVTPLGKTMAQYPISPRHSRLLLQAIQLSKEKRGSVRPNLVLGYAVAAATALSVDSPYSFRYEGSQTNTEDQDKEHESGFLGSQKSRDQHAKSMMKQMRESANCCSATFAKPKSDALTVAYTLQLFEQSRNRTQFCKENTLNLKIMVELSKLRKQLLNIVFKERNQRVQPEFSWSHGTIKDVEDNWAVASDKYPLSQKEENILCEAICAGWIDMVAKRTSARESSDGDRKVNAIRYQASSMAKGTVFLGHWSSVHEAPPEFLVYHELNCTKRPYIYRATSVNPEWLAKLSGPLLCKYLAPSTNQKPVYDPHCDQVFNHVIPYFCRHMWELPPDKVPIEDDEERTKVFAYALLDGQVLPCLKIVKNVLVSLPSIILKPEALGQKRVSNLISKLRGRTIDSFAELKEAWKEDSLYLYLELLDFFKKDSRLLFDKLWGIMHKEAFSVPQGRTRKRKRGNRG